MIEVVVNLSLATMCFLGQCHPVLIGEGTPTGVFPLQRSTTTDAGYGGTVIAYAVRDNGRTLSIHRPWLGKPSQRRLERLKSPNPRDRQGVSAGCINAESWVFDALWACQQCNFVEITK